jgi:hypothetical protein
MEAMSMRNEDRDYDRLVSAMRIHFENAASGGPLFTTDAEGLFEAYLSGFPEADRQYHNCNNCRRFIERFGGLVTIDDHGMTHAAIWPLVEGSSYWDSVAAVAKRVPRTREVRSKALERTGRTCMSDRPDRPSTAASR